MGAPSLIWRYCAVKRRARRRVVTAENASNRPLVSSPDEPDSSPQGRDFVPLGRIRGVRRFGVDLAVRTLVRGALTLIS